MKDTNNSSAVPSPRNDKEIEKKPDSSADLRKVPIDTGYAWIILLGKFFSSKVAYTVKKLSVDLTVNDWQPAARAFTVTFKRAGKTFIGM